jgi:hypothetical protein
MCAEVFAVSAGRTLLTVGEIAQRVGCFESKARSTLGRVPGVVVKVGRLNCVAVEDPPAVRAALERRKGQKAAREPAPAE